MPVFSYDAAAYYASASASAAAWLHGKANPTQALHTKITVLTQIAQIITIIMSTTTSGNKDTDSQQAGSVSSTTIQQASTQWAEIIGQLFDRLTGKGASVTYTFDNLVIDMPKATGPNGQDMGSAKWTINGKIVITAEAHKTAEEARQRALTASAS